MSETIVRDPEIIVSALSEIQGEYRVEQAARNMLLIISAMILPLAFLIIVRLTANFMPAIVGMLIGGTLVFVVFLWLIDALFSVMRLGPTGMDRSSPWPWQRWRIPVHEISALGTTRKGKGRYLLVETVGGKSYYLPFQAGFNRVMPILEGRRQTST